LAAALAPGDASSGYQEAMRPTLVMC